jgi:hypothetical protein
MKHRKIDKKLYDFPENAFLKVMGLGLAFFVIFTVVYLIGFYRWN